MKLLDTNVFLYAMGSPHPLRGPCEAVLDLVDQAPRGYVVDVELLQEILHVYDRRGQRSRGLEVFDAIMVLFPEPESVTPQTIKEARLLTERHRGISPRDAVHAAVVLERGLEGLVTADKAFRTIPGLRVWEPAEMS